MKLKLKLSVYAVLLSLFILLFSGCQDDEAIPEVPVPQPETPDSLFTNSWILNSLQDVANYSKEIPANEVSLFLSKNEAEHFQLVLRTKADCPVYMPNSKNNANISSQLRRIALFQGYNDILIPTGSKLYPENNEIKLWITYQSKPKAAAGTYEDTLYFKSMDQTYPIYVHLTIQDVTLPITPTFPATFGIEADNFPMAKGISEEAKNQIRKEVADLLLSYRISPYFCSWISNTNRIEVSSSPFPVGDARMLDYLKDPRFSMIALPYRRLTDTQLRTMLMDIQNNGLINKSYFYPTDEVRNIAGYNELKTIATKIHGYAPEAKLLTTFNQGPDDNSQKANFMKVFDYLHGYADIFCTGVTVMKSPEDADLIRNQLRNDEEWWTYVCLNNVPGMTFKSSPVASRAVMWRSWKEQTQGSLFWVVNGFETFSPLTQRYSLPLGDGILVYPGDPLQSDVSCVSIRLERWRDGAEDYELLRMMEDRIGRSQTIALLNSVYLSPMIYTDETEAVFSFKKSLLDGLSE